jgi:hypothetical protein
MTTGTRILGLRPTSHPARPNRTKPKGRVCADPSCSTPLSIYNLRDRCGAHEMPVTPLGYGGRRLSYGGPGDVQVEAPACQDCGRRLTNGSKRCVVGTGCRVKPDPLDEAIKAIR